jgi:phosphoserine phosphatase
VPDLALFDFDGTLLMANVAYHLPRGWPEGLAPGRID